MSIKTVLLSACTDFVPGLHSQFIADKTKMNGEGKPIPFSSDHMTWNGLNAANYPGLGTEQDEVDVLVIGIG